MTRQIIKDVELEIQKAIKKNQKEIEGAVF